MLLNKCCCCAELRTGAIILGVLHLIGAALPLKDLKDGVTWYAIVDAILNLGAAGCLLFGAIKNNKRATLLYLILDIVIIAFAIGVGIYLIFWTTWTTTFADEMCRMQGACTNEERQMAGPILGFSYLCVVALYVYFFLCIYSFYQSLEEVRSGGRRCGRGNPA